MKNINKKLYSVIIACLLMLCFSVVAMATNITDSSIETLSSVTSEPSSKEEPAQTPSDNEIISSKTDSEVSSKLNSQTETSTSIEVNSNSNVTSTESVEALSSATETSSKIQEETVSYSGSEATSSKVTDLSSTTTSAKTSSVQSKKENSSSKSTTSKKVNSNIGGVVVDEPDTSEWGNSEDTDTSKAEDSEKLSSFESVSSNSNHKRTDKNITNFTSLFWILIWIPVLLILASVGALVYVNRKAFLEEENVRFDDAIESAPAKKKISSTEKAKRKNNHKNRTNVYRPRD